MRVTETVCLSVGHKDCLLFELIGKQNTVQDVKYPTRCQNHDDKSNGFTGYCTVDVCDLHDGLVLIEHIGVHMAVILQRCKEHTAGNGIGVFCACVIVYFVPEAPRA